MPAWLRRQTARIPLPRSVAEVSALVALGAALRWALVRGTQLPEAAYHRPIVLIEIAQQPFVLALLLVPGAVAIAKRSQLSWQKLALEPGMRALLCSLIAVVAWSASGYSLNLYLGQTHAADRLLVVILAVASCIHPGFTGTFLVCAWVMTHQLRYPIGPYAWADVAPLLNLLSLYFAALLLRAGSVATATPLLPVALAVHAAHYFHSGLGKLLLGWPVREDLAHFFRAHRAVGWSAGLNDAAAARVADALHTWSAPLSTAVMALELLAALMLWRRRLTMALLVALTLMHLGTFALSGIFFWQWIWIDLGLLLVCTRLFHDPENTWFGSRAWLWGSVLLVLTAPLHLKPATLAWLDTRLQNFYRLEVTTARGSVFEVKRSELAPFDGVFTQGRLQFLDDQVLLVDTFGETREPSIAEAVERLSDSEQTARLEVALGRSSYDPERAERFDRFVRRWFAVAPPHRPWYTLASPPATTRPSTLLPAYDWKEPIVSLQVRRIKVLWTGSRSLVLNTDVIRRVTIP